MENTRALFLTIDFGSNSNKYLISLYKDQKLYIIKKGSVIHRIKKEQNIEDYEKKLAILFNQITYSITSLKKKYNTDKFITLAVGTEFYRHTQTITPRVIELNKKYLNTVNTNFLVLTQEEESYYSSKVIDFFFREYIAIDLGGGSTEITVKHGNKHARFLYPFGCLSETNEYTFTKDFLDYYSNLQNELDLILMGGSFISTLLSIENIKTEKIFFHILETAIIENFYNSIINLKDNELIIRYPALIGREKSIKKALDFAIYLLRKIKKEKVIISLLTLLEGLTIYLIELNKLELSKIDFIQDS
ncbi:MAG: hypothetical protein N2657_00060 [bacterium]|nr:hypothetical protein [bacterium]